MIYLTNSFKSVYELVAGTENKNLLILYTVLLFAASIISAYLLGSLNSAIIVSKAKYHDDIRKHGSGNAGLTNMMRVYGKGGAGLTLLGDVLKQAVSVFIGFFLLDIHGAYISGIFCMLGHIFPVYYHFKGGKGVLTAATMILIIDPIIFAILFLIFAIVLLITRYVSLSSIIAAFAYPAAVYYASKVRTGKPAEMFDMIFALLVGIIVIYMHRQNIYRLFNNQESKFSFKKKPEAQKILDMEDHENDEDFEIPKKEKKSSKKKKSR